MSLSLRSTNNQTRITEEEERKTEERKGDDDGERKPGRQKESKLVREKDEISIW